MARPKAGFHDLFAQVPDALWDALAQEAAQSQRSITKQLVWILQERYPDAAANEPPAKKARKR
jgi:hypothetical protein